MTGEFEYPTSSHWVLGYLNPMGKNLGYWSIFSWIQSYIHTYMTYETLQLDPVFSYGEL